MSAPWESDEALLARLGTVLDELDPMPAEVVTEGGHCSGCAAWTRNWPSWSGTAPRTAAALLAVRGRGRRAADLVRDRAGDRRAAGDRARYGADLVAQVTGTALVGAEVETSAGRQRHPDRGLLVHRRGRPCRLPPPPPAHRRRPPPRHQLGPRLTHSRSQARRCTAASGPDPRGSGPRLRCLEGAGSHGPAAPDGIHRQRGDTALTLRVVRRIGFPPSGLRVGRHRLPACGLRVAGRRGRGRRRTAHTSSPHFWSGCIRPRSGPAVRRTQPPECGCADGTGTQGHESSS